MKFITTFPDFEPRVYEIRDQFLMELRKEHEINIALLHKMRLCHKLLEKIVQKVGVAEDD